MNERSSICEVRTVWVTLECQPNDRFIQRIYLPTLQKQEQKKARAKKIKKAFINIGIQFVRILLGMIVSFLVADWVVPLSYAERGYLAFGGEWILIVFAGTFTYFYVSRRVITYFKRVRNGK